MIYIISFITFLTGIAAGFLICKLQNAQKNIELTRLQEKLNSKDEIINSLKNVEELVKIHFANIANNALKEKQTELDLQNTKLLEPLSKNLEAFRQRLEDFSKEGTVNTQTIKTQIETLLNENKTIKNTANELTNALKENSQIRGELGEVILENILKSSGLKNKNDYGEAGNYITQTTFKDLNNPTSTQTRPDAVIFFPDNKHIVVDSKFPLNDFKEFVNAQNQEDKDKYLKNFFSQVEKMIADLSEKYNNLDGLYTPDFKLMFIPFESILGYVLNNTKLIEFANSKNILIVGPSTLLVTLRIIHYCWAQKNQAENIAQILKLGETMYSKCNILIERIETLKNKFISTENYFDEVMKPLCGKNGLTSLIEKFTDYGLNPAKRIPEQYLQDADMIEINS